MTEEARARDPGGPLDARALILALAGELARVSHDLGRIEALSSSLAGQVAELPGDAVELLQELDRLRQTTAGLGLLLERLAPALAGVAAPAAPRDAEVLLESVARRLFSPPAPAVDEEPPGRPGDPALF